MGSSGMRCLGTVVLSPSGVKSGLIERYCPSDPSPVTFVCSAIALLLSATSTLEEDQQDEHDVDDDVHEPAVDVHPVAHLGHHPLGAPAKQQVSQHRKRRYKDGCRYEGHSAHKGGVVMREVYPAGH